MRQLVRSRGAKEHLVDLKGEEEQWPPTPKEEYIGAPDTNFVGPSTSPMTTVSSAGVGRDIGLVKICK
ncbi:hypothetical protein Y032_0082g1578 [Ancylostoma ceylanicum]|uniref:Uncharacterized protein n=1 Tax=Ancylostoma ceylanicum TaxID=53326 RepID=A0A016TSQ6_9BILA|nr:hypothetical protein Y032_0082g1578 [Ancylostoma ceylanicum]